MSNIFFIYFLEQACATTSYIKFSYAKVNGLELIPQTDALVCRTSMVWIWFSSYILSIILIHRCSKHLKRSILYNDWIYGFILEQGSKKMSQFGYLYYFESSSQAFASNKSSFLEAALESSLRKAEHTKPDTVEEENKYVIFQK